LIFTRELYYTLSKMAIELGKNPWLLIGLTILEILFVLLPAYSFSKIKKISIKDAIREMGFQKNDDLFIKTIAGISFGILFYFLGGYLVIFFRNIITRSIFGSEFIIQAEEGAINTDPATPSFIQIIFLIVLQILIVGPCEEAFFRGFLIKNIAKKIKLIYSILISSCLFTFFHIPPLLVPLSTIITYFGYYFSLGLLLSLLFVYFNNSLIPCSIAHSCFNILILIV